MRLLSVEIPRSLFPLRMMVHRLLSSWFLGLFVPSPL